MLANSGELVTKTQPITDDMLDNKFSITGQGISSKAKTFNVAFGLSDMHDSREPIEDKDYGMLLPFAMKREKSGIFSYEMLDWQPCT